MNTKMTNGNPDDLMIVQHRSSPKTKCLELCARRIECEGVNVRKISGREVECQILFNVSESAAAQDPTWALYVKKN